MIRDFGYSEATPTAIRPIAPPRIEGFRLLKTLGEFAAEGERMEHCVACYARRAVMGTVYILHIEHHGEQATVAIDNGGKVLQVADRRNSDNQTCAWARQQLGGWCMKLAAKNQESWATLRHILPRHVRADLPIEVSTGRDDSF